MSRSLPIRTPKCSCDWHNYNLDPDENGNLPEGHTIIALHYACSRHSKILEYLNKYEKHNFPSVWNGTVSLELLRELEYKEMAGKLLPASHNRFMHLDEE